MTQALTQLSGWGAYLRSSCRYELPETAADVAARLDRRGTIARGLGRSYGDPAQNAAGQVLGLSHLDRYLSFDEHSGLLTCEAGVSLAQIITAFTPRGFFPMVTPGTRYVTVGGCIANDVHGKAHHVDGSFNSCVESMTVLLADGRVVTASRSDNPDLFWGSFGGMGLLGIVLTASIRLRKIETVYFRKRSIRVDSLDAMLDALEENDRQFPYSVAYVDPFAVGARLGAGILTVGDHARLDELPEDLARRRLSVSGDPKLGVPFDLPEFTLNPLSMRAANVVFKWKLSGTAPFMHYDEFFYPLDWVAEWNRGYGKRGFTQYQFVIPFEDGRRQMRELLGVIVSSGQLPFLNVLKRFGQESLGPLSFPRAGYTFAIDFPIRDHTGELMQRLDRMVLDAGGRIYLGKDAFVDAAMFRAMYPRLDQWLAIKAKYDPNNVFVSDLARRVGLLSAATTDKVVRAARPQSVVGAAAAVPAEP
jgi:decaprenylphospho-beta-D-ribofuranose 2-oxidase